MKIYISGPITGRDPEQVKLAFDTAEQEIRSKGHEPVNPHKLQNILAPETTTWEQYMRPALALLSICDAICMLDGWIKSKGAHIEHAHAWAEGITIFDDTSNIWDAEQEETEAADERR